MLASFMNQKWWTQFRNDGNVPTQYVANTASNWTVKFA